MQCKSELSPGDLPNKQRIRKAAFDLYIPTKNKAAYSRISLLIKITRGFMCIMAVYGIKDSVSTFKHSKARVNTEKMKKCR